MSIEVTVHDPKPESVLYMKSLDSMALRIGMGEGRLVLFFSNPEQLYALRRALDEADDMFHLKYHDDAEEYTTLEFKK